MIVHATALLDDLEPHPKTSLAAERHPGSATYIHANDQVWPRLNPSNNEQLPQSSTGSPATPAPSLP